MRLRGPHSVTGFFSIALLLAAGCSQRGAFQSGPAPLAVSSLAQGSFTRPVLAQAENETLYLLAADSTNQKLVLTMSHDGGDTFMPPVAVNPEGTHAQFRAENGPTLLARGMNVFALWQQSTDQGSAVVFAKQSRMGQPFSSPTVVTDKPATDKSYNGFSSMALGPRGEVYVVWLDGREPTEPKGTFGLYFAASFDQGATFSKNLRVASAACPCCRPSIQVADDGTIYVAWRKVFEGDIRDIVIASSKDNGRTFSEPVKAAADNWVLHACPDSGPSLQVRNGLLSIAWYSQGGGKAGIRYAESKDGGKTFSAPVMASKDVANPNHPVLLDTGDGRVLLFQGRSTGGDQALGVYAARISATGDLSSPTPVPGAEHATYPAAVGMPGSVTAVWSSSGEKSTVHLTHLRW